MFQPRPLSQFGLPPCREIHPHFPIYVSNASIPFCLGGRPAPVITLSSTSPQPQGNRSLACLFQSSGLSSSLDPEGQAFPCSGPWTSPRPLSFAPSSQWTQWPASSARPVISIQTAPSFLVVSVCISLLQGPCPWARPPYLELSLVVIGKLAQVSEQETQRR